MGPNSLIIHDQDFSELRMAGDCFKLMMSIQENNTASLILTSEKVTYVSYWEQDKKPCFYFYSTW